MIADETVRRLLQRLVEHFDGRLAIISGRSLAQIDHILGEIAQALALSGSHGNEHRWKGISAHPVRPPELDRAAQALQALAASHAGALVEEKSYGVAFHYRMAPAAEPEAQVIAARLSDELGLELQKGKMMVELRVGGGDKGLAIRRLMSRPPMAGTVPLFIGDDETDEAGFRACRELGGGGVLVGAPRATAATYFLPDPAAVRAWLATVVDA